MEKSFFGGFSLSVCQVQVLPSDAHPQTETVLRGDELTINCNYYKALTEPNCQLDYLQDSVTAEKRKTTDAVLGLISLLTW